METGLTVLVWEAVVLVGWGLLCAVLFVAGMLMRAANY